MCTITTVWLPSDGKPISVDILICQNISHAAMAPVSSYPRRKKSAVCANLSTSCRIQPPSQGLLKPKARLGVSKLVPSPRGACQPCVCTAVFP